MPAKSSGQSGWRLLYYVVLLVMSVWAAFWVGLSVYEYATSPGGGEAELGLVVGLLVGLAPLALHLVIAFVVRLVICIGRSG